MIVSKKYLNKTLLVISYLIGSFALISTSHAQQNVNEAQTQASKHILVFGDSLSAAFGIDIEQGWVHLLDEYLNNEYSLKQADTPFFQISNASISGETTTGGLARLELTLQELKPDMVFSIPASYGPRYIDKFRDIFPTVAQQRNLPFLDLYQEDFFLKPGYIQDDGLHPTAIGQPIVRDLISGFLEQQKLLQNTKE